MKRLLLLILGWSLAVITARADGDSAELVVDAAKPAGTLRPLHGVNSGPLAQGGTLDLSAAFRAIAPPLVRLHDCHWPNPDVVDLHVVFPDPNADPARPESYDFARTDEYLRAIAGVGSGIVFRLGESIEHQKVKRHVHPPKDPDRWAAVCLGVIRHYNEGWANGLRLDIRYWEIWNEPDNRPAMWTGTDDDYFRLYRAAATAIKRHFPALKVGGPGLGNTGRLVGDALEPAPFLTRFLDFCRREAVPLDFFSWHVYTNDPPAVARRARAVRRLLDRSGFAKAESHLNEWNYLPDDDWGPLLSPDPRARQRWHEALGGPAGAAFTAATLLLAQDAPLDAANYFSADSPGMGLFNPYGVPTKTFHAIKAFKMLTDAPQRLPLRGDRPAGLAAAAGVNRARDTVTLLVSRYRGAAAPLTVAVKNLPWPGPSRYAVHVVDDRHDLDRVRAGPLPADGRLTLELRGPSVSLVTLRPAE